MRYLLISEKPSLMRAVQSAFYKARMGFDVDFIPLHGHCCTLFAPEDYNESWKKWRMEDLPIIPETYKHKPVDKDLVKQIQQKLKENHYDGLINCTDAEREGQNIFYSLYDYLGCSLPVKRFWASDLTEPKLIDAWHNLRDDQHEPFLKNLTNASLLRANADWLVGMNFSRAVSIANEKVIPVGRVMTVVLAILGKREDEITNFKPVDTYKVLAHYKEGFDGEYETIFEKKEEADKFIASLAKTGTVSSAERREKKSQPPLLYSLGDLQNDANKAYGYTLTKSLDLIQALYEKKLLSYPRTDTQYLTSGEAKRMDQILAACRCVPELTDIAVRQDKVDNYAKTKYVNDKKVQAHYAIVLTGNSFDFNSLTKDEKNIMTLVAKRIIATLLDEAIYDETEIHVDISGNDFVTKESTLKQLGYLALYGKKTEQSKLKNIQDGQKVDINEFENKTVTSTCPPRYNDSSLNKAMINVGTLIEDKELAKALKGETKDQGGIGTPATRAGIVEKVLERGWAQRKGKVFEVTRDGMGVYHLLMNYSVASPILTAQWETKLQQVANGEKDPGEFTTEINTYIHEELDALKTLKMDQTEADRCPVCGGVIKESKNYFYCENYKNPCQFIVGKVTAGATITHQDLQDLLSKGSTRVKNFKNKDNKPFKAKLIFKDNKVQFGFDNGDACNCVCGGTVQEKDGQFGKYYRCSKCGKTMSANYLGHKFTKKEVQNLFEGEEIKVKGLTSKAGKKFDALVSLDDKLSLRFD